MKLAGASSTMITKVLKIYATGRLKGVTDIAHYFRKSDLEQHRETIVKYLQETLPASATEAGAEIYKLTRLQPGETQTKVFLRKLGLRPRKAAAVPAKANIEAQEEFKKKSGANAKRSKSLCVLATWRLRVSHCLHNNVINKLVLKGATMTIDLSVIGATGKMGKRLLELALNDPEFRITGASSRQQLDSSLSSLFADKGLQVPFFSDPLAAFRACDVAIDFTSHLATKNHLKAAIQVGKPLVIGTTGHSPKEKNEIKRASQTIPILYSPNFSFGMALCLSAAASFGKALYGTCAIDIVETHHIHKKDSPSGTAYALASAIGNGRVVTDSARAPPRKNEEIAIQSIRSGETVGEHTIIFECGHERIELKHTAHSRDAFAQGALMGAKFLTSQPPGLYSLKDLFF
jgi:4-hydroxy-tetrahydrodipicolinate reductase